MDNPLADLTATSPTDQPANDGLTMIVFSGDLDKVLAAFIIANGAAAMEMEVTMFFTFWGLNVLRKPKPPKVKKELIPSMFAMMMPRGPEKLALSRMHMFGIGTRLMKKVMREKNVFSLPKLMKTAQEAGVTLVACSMSMDMMGLTREELIDDIDYGGVASFLDSAYHSKTTLFI